MSSTAHEPQINRTVVFVSLGLALALVLAVLVGARVFYNRVALQPVAMSELPAPEASSPECASLIDALPGSLAGLKRAELAEPAPAGAAAWQSSSTERITLRCGVDLPAQYTPYSQTQDVGGAQWLRVDDATPGSDLTTWYAVDRSPALAVTASGERSRDDEPPVADLDTSALSALSATAPHPNPAPLADLPAAAGASGACAELLGAAPDSIAEGYTRVAEPANPDTAAWAAPGRDAIVLRCGVAAPASYRPGARLDQVNGVPWFEDVTLANGTTASTWYALGRTVNVAASLPQAESNEAITNLTNLIEAHTAKDPAAN